MTRSHRWSQQTPAGILYESLGDLYLKNGTKIKNLTESTDHETSPYYDPRTRKVYYASWNDNEMGAVFQIDLSGNKRRKLQKKQVNMVQLHHPMTALWLI